jgi:hypothetical protein
VRTPGSPSFAGSTGGSISTGGVGACLGVGSGVGAAAATAFGIGAANHVTPNNATPAHNAASAIPRLFLNVIRDFIRLETFDPS